MLTFYYTAKNIAGEVKEGKRNASNERALAHSLRVEGFILITAKRKLKREILLPSFLTPVSLVEKMFFTKHLSVMLGAGVSLPKALEILKKLSKSTRFKRIIEKIKGDIQGGVALSEAFAKFPKIFNELFVSMIKVGEEAGNLEEVLSILSRHLKRQREITQRVKGAMMYPLVIVVAMGGIGIVMMLFVVPKLFTVFEELGAELPWTTKLIISITQLLQKNGPLVAIAVFLIVFLLRFIIKKVKPTKKLFHGMVLRAPVLGKILKKLYLARFSRTFGSLIKGGLPLTKSLLVSSRTLGNVCYQESLVKAVQIVKKGTSLNEALGKFPKLYSPLVVQMISVGEETGTLIDVLERLAEFYEEEVTEVTKNLASIIEPLLMIIIGAVVGFFAISMITPIYSMMGTL